ncbi:MAG: Hsp20 family protein [Candidatus Hydrogenedens sp.]|nr:Hsp20 family protein [Candidatus Hydrogenedens sp.]
MSTLMTRGRSPVDPFSGWRGLDAGLSRLFEGFPSEIADKVFSPAVDFREEKDHYVLEADLPGLKKEDIELSVVDNVLTIKGNRSGEEWKQNGGYRSIERSFGSFQRSFGIPGGVDQSKAEASYTDGVLRVTLPKSESAKPRQIAVTTK